MVDHVPISGRLIITKPVGVVIKRGARIDSSVVCRPPKEPSPKDCDFAIRAGTQATRAFRIYTVCVLSILVGNPDREESCLCARYPGVSPFLGHILTIPLQLAF